MRAVKQNNGFTLIEIIVGINLGFLLLTIVITFFLFSLQFISATTKRLETKRNTNDLLIRFGTVLKKSDNFCFEKKDSVITFITNSQDSILIGHDYISLMNLYRIKDIKDFSLVFEMVTGKQLLFSSESLSSLTGNNNTDKIVSGEIESISLGFIKNEKKYHYTYNTPNTSVNRFKNLEN